MKALIVDTDDVLALFGASDEDIYATGTIEDAIYDGTLKPAELEIKTGRWICGDTGLMVTEYKCSECGRTVRDDTGYDVYLDYPYCHCGAKMLKTEN